MMYVFYVHFSCGSKFVGYLRRLLGLRDICAARTGHTSSGGGQRGGGGLHAGVVCQGVLSIYKMCRLMLSCY